MSHSFDARDNLIVVSAEVFGPDGSVVAEMALDTGATTSTLNWELLLAIGYDPAKTKDFVKVTTGSGVERSPIVTVRRLVALGIQRRNFELIGHDLPPSASVDGLLGLDYLRRRRLTIDFRKGALELV